MDLKFDFCNVREVFIISMKHCRKFLFHNHKKQLNMKLKIWLAIIALAIPGIMFSQLKLTVEIEGLKNSKGQILFQLLDENQKELKGMKTEIKNNKCIIVVSDLQPGKYGFRYFHDENGNSSMDKSMLGIPKEGFGFSNNAKVSFGPPSFDKWLFDLKSATVMNCKPTYM
jgi:uncharacterized protein (DUF2141 family)